MRDRSEWTEGRTGEHKIGKKTYKALTEFTRPCVTCGERFSVFVTKKIADGLADSNSFGLKNCEKHRRTVNAAEVAHAETTSMANSVMKAELDGLYSRNAVLEKQNADLKARLAVYELQPAMERAGQAGMGPEGL